MKVFARHYLTNQPLSIEIDTGRYLSIQSFQTSDLSSLPYIAPGLVDIQINGFGGVDFNRSITNFSAWQQACDSLFSKGCTHFLIALITHPKEEISNLFQCFEIFRKQDAFNCIGYHLEGPFLNPNSGYCGAHSPEWMVIPSREWLEEWCLLSNNQIRLITLAPEINPAIAFEFIQQAVLKQIRISIGHSEAKGELLQQAIAAGASSWTHLGNALPATQHKFDNVIFNALAQPSLLCSIIPDGIHVPSSAFKVMVEALGNRLLLTTDAMAGASAPAGKYSLGKLEINIGSDGIARMAESGRLAGSTLTPFEGVFKAAQLSGKPWNEMWQAFSVRPASWLGLFHDLKLNASADLCLFQMEPVPFLLKTLHKGKVVFESQ